MQLSLLLYVKLIHIHSEDKLNMIADLIASFIMVSLELHNIVRLLF
jgi:hypothetical protein